VATWFSVGIEVDAGTVVAGCVVVTRHDERGAGTSYLATTGDLNLAISGDFSMATDTGLGGLLGGS